MPWVVSDRSYRVTSSTLGDVLVPQHEEKEVPQWAYDILIGLEGVQAWSPDAPLPTATFDPLPKHQVPAEFYDPHFFDPEGGLVSDDTFGGLPV